MKVLVVSEGKHELGFDSKSPLVELTRRLTNYYSEFVRMPVSSPEVHRHFIHGRTADYEKKALGWLRYAQNNNYDAMVLVIDQDGKKDRETGVAKAQDHDHFLLPRAMGVAIRSFDAWMLADEVALSQVIGRQIQPQKDPETIKNPKSLCKTLHDQADDDFSLSEMYLRLSLVINLDRLSNRCKRGFAPFRKRVEALPKDTTGN